ncbi:MAG TPA: type VI secretion system accessory protein TagJ [Longimicrobiaceae bacterium]|nr:type VI secretion system accessory protein TagJ [Longimicrobiaceae bacterium]
MNATELYRAGRLDEAIQALGADLRANPTDAQRRTFLFELLCFAGEYDRAEKQLDVLADASTETEMGALLYRSALHAARTRHQMFADGSLPSSSEPSTPLTGSLNGRPFSSLTDADPRIGGRLEIFAAGQYTWLPLDKIASIRIEPPRQLRDLLWIPAVVKTAEDFQALELGEVLLPVLTPLASTHPDPEVRLGRVTVWEEVNGAEVPAGQRLFLIDDEEVPLLEIRQLEIQPAPAATA